MNNLTYATLDRKRTFLQVEGVKNGRAYVPLMTQDRVDRGQSELLNIEGLEGGFAWKRFQNNCWTSANSDIPSEH